MRTKILTPLHYQLAAFALVGVLMVTAPNVATAQNQLPPGTYTTTITAQDLPGFPPAQGNWEITFTADHFSAALNRVVQAEGLLAVKQDQLTLTDVSGPAAATDSDAVGTYKWSFDGKALTLTNVNDNNPNRATVLTAHPLQLKSSPARLPTTGDDTVASTRGLLVLVLLILVLVSVGLVMRRRRNS